nr:reverse transcriptase domain-containing protein [Tanacetum cinerariifolium]
MSSNTASSSGSGTLPSNIVTNPKEDLKSITTGSGVSCQGPTIPNPSKQETEVTKDQVQTPSSKSTAPVQSPIAKFETQTPMSKPVVAPISVLMPNLKPSIPHPSRRMDECLALSDLGTSINLMPLSVWEELSLLKLTSTYMTLELMDRSVSKPIGIAKDVSVKVGELTLRIENKAITYNLDQTSRYSANYNQMTANKIDFICEEYPQDVLGLLDTTASGNPTPYDDPIVSTTSLTLTPFGDSDFLLFEEANSFLGLEDDPNLPEFTGIEAILNSEPLPLIPNHEQYTPSYKKELKETDEFLAIEDEPISSKIDDSFYDSEGDILLLKEFLNDDPSSPPLSLQDLKVVEPKNEKSSIDEPP